MKNFYYSYNLSQVVHLKVVQKNIILVFIVHIVQGGFGGLWLLAGLNVEAFVDVFLVEQVVDAVLPLAA